MYIPAVRKHAPLRMHAKFCSIYKIESTLQKTLVVHGNPATAQLALSCVNIEGIDPSVLVTLFSGESTLSGTHLPVQLWSCAHKFANPTVCKLMSITVITTGMS